jgi:putative lipoprotein
MNPSYPVGEELRALTVFAALSVLLGCSDPGVSGSADLPRWSGNPIREVAMADPAQASLRGTSWLAEDIGGRGVIDRAQTTISFEPDDRVAGSGGCNRYFGSVTIEGDAITFSNKLGSTMMACAPALMDQERRFFDALAATRSYRFDDPGHKLVFLGEDGAPLVRFSQATP